MSQLIPFGQSSNVPAYLNQAGPSTMDSLVVASVPRISTAQGRLQLVKSGQPVGQAQAHLDVIIIGGAPAGRETHRTWYAQRYDPNANQPPDCFSADGVHPAQNASKPQSRDCASCPMNVKGSGERGGKACRYSKHLAVVIPAEGFWDDVWQVRLPATSLFTARPVGASWFALQEYVAELKARGYPWEAVLTRMDFSNGATNGVVFTPIGIVPEDHYRHAVRMGQSEATHAALEFDVAAGAGRPDPSEDSAPGAAYQESIAAQSPMSQPAPHTPAPPPSTPAPSAGLVMLASAAYSYEQYRDAGWTDDALVQAGLAEKPTPPAPPPPPPPPPPPAPPAPPPAPPAPPAPSAPPPVQQQAQTELPAVPEAPAITPPPTYGNEPAPVTPPPPPPPVQESAPPAPPVQQAAVTEVLDAAPSDTSTPQGRIAAVLDNF